jgi:hypothetical protein
MSILYNSLVQQPTQGHGNSKYWGDMTTPNQSKFYRPNTAKNL